MSRRKTYRKKYSAREKKRIFIGIIVVILFIVSLTAAIYFIILSGP